jgi:LysR family hydrogen peroxide-inducible transcriptional activator
MRWAPHPVSLRQLQYVVAVADSRSFRRAAELCHVSQPSLSSQVAQLEGALGAQLFERDRRRVLLTKAGEELTRRARRMLVEAEDLVDAAAQFTDPLAGKLRIGVIPTISPYLLPEIAPALHAAFPRLRVLWTEDRTPRLVASLAAGELDAALLALEANLGDVEHEVIGYDPFVLASAPPHPLTGPAKSLQPAELEDADVLLLEDGHCLRDQALAVCGNANFLDGEFRATSLATLIQMVAGSRGVTLLPSLAIATENRRGQLRLRKFASPAPGRTLALVWRRGGPAEASLRQIAGVMRGQYDKLARDFADPPSQAGKPKRARR